MLGGKEVLKSQRHRENFALYTLAKDPQIHKHILICGPSESFRIPMYFDLLQSPLCNN